MYDDNIMDRTEDKSNTNKSDKKQPKIKQHKEKQQDRAFELQVIKGPITLEFEGGSVYYTTTST